MRVMNNYSASTVQGRAVLKLTVLNSISLLCGMRLMNDV